MRKIVFLFLAIPAFGQTPLSLPDAVRLALRQNPTVAAAHAGVGAAEARLPSARSGILPKLNFSESWARSNNPVFVFSSLLTQHQFGIDNFNIGPLNRPDALNNFQSLITLDQPIYDGGQTHRAVQSAELGRDLSAEERRRAEMETIAGVTRAYYGAVLAAESLHTAEQAVRSAQADLRRAESVRSAGMSTDADVLSIRVHLAAVDEQRIRRAAGLDVARAALNDALGLPLETPHQLTTPLNPLDMDEPDLAAVERDATADRPEARESSLAARLAQVQLESARSSILPTIGFHAAFETDTQRFVTLGGANWLTSISLRWNVFNGGADKAKTVEADHWLERARADEKRAGSAVKLQARRAFADLRAARQRIEVARASVAEADESLRITQNRYQAGMANVTDLLRTETAVLESRTRYLSAVHDQRVAATMLELAAGRLTADSEVITR